MNALLSDPLTSPIWSLLTYLTQPDLTLFFLTSILTYCEVDLIEVLEVMAQTWQYIFWYNWERVHSDLNKNSV